MKTKKLTSLWIIIALSMFIHFLCFYLQKTVMMDWRWSNEPIHASIEVAGSIIAFLVAGVLLSLQKRQQGTNFNYLIAAALIVMGILDGFHALTHAGKIFIWFHSTATFLGGIFFSLICFSSKIPPSFYKRWVPLSCLSTIFFIGLSVLFPDFIPTMAIKGEFTPLAKTLNIAGGILLFVAAIRLLISHIKTQNFDDLLFFMHCALFGTAAIMFEQSSLWDFSWWGWHILRFLAYGVALWFVILTDKRLQLEAQERLLLANKDLEDRVKQRTSELLTYQKKLEESKDYAEIASKTKSEFLANMSHEIRTPMNAVLGFTDILIETEEDSKKQGYLHNIHTSGKALLSLINDILDLSKIESGKMELQYTPMSLLDLGNDLKALFSQKMEAKKLDFQLNIENDLPDTILMDETRLRQVLTNLIGNSTKFTNEGSIALSIEKNSTTFQDSGFIDLKLTVTDTGIGIPKNQQEHIFKTFEQVAGQKYKDFGGTGLGLAISKQIIHQMKGKISVDSTEGEGTSFTVTISNLEISSTNTKALAQKKLDFSKISFAPIKILIVDDIAYNIEIITTYLAAWGFQIETAQNGQEGLEKAQFFQPDLILTDIKMPIMDGYQFSKALRENNITKETPIVAITASALKEDEEAIRKICNGYLRKPLAKQDLIQELMLHISHEIKKDEQPESSLENKQSNNKPNLDSSFRDLFYSLIIEQSKKNNFQAISSLATQLHSFSKEKNIPELTVIAIELKTSVEDFDIPVLKSHLLTLQKWCES